MDIEAYFSETVKLLSVLRTMGKIEDHTFLFLDLFGTRWLLGGAVIGRHGAGLETEYRNEADQVLTLDSGCELA